MISVRKLGSLPGPTRRRKYPRVLRMIEEELRRGARPDPAYLGELLLLISGDNACGEEVRRAASGAGFLSGDPDTLLRGCNGLRHLLLFELGGAPADWDLLPPRSSGLDARKVFPLDLYLDGLRSPFNIGSIFRAADSFGVRSVFLSEECADPLHPRSLRSAMGCVDHIPWERVSAEDFSRRFGDSTVAAMETGGTPLESFEVPDSVLLVIGSEELGVRPELLETARGSGGVVSITTGGLKGSINVAVAAGIVLHEWFRALMKR